MLLRDVRLYLSDEFPRVNCSEFSFRSCYISHFLTRWMRICDYPVITRAF